MAEESQPTKRHKQSETHTEQNIPQASPNGDELDTQMPFPMGKRNINWTTMILWNQDEKRNSFLTQTSDKPLMIN